MLAFVDGRYVPEDSPALTVRDRSFMYGDGLFETIRIINAQPFLWNEHLDRLARGCEFLRIKNPFGAAEMAAAVRHLISQNVVIDGVVRLHLSRGIGLRGYTPKGADNPTLVITAHPLTTPPPTKLRVITSTVRVLSDDPSSRFKTANRLTNIRARIEADEAGVDEALIKNDRDEIAEASSANIFIFRGDHLLTPGLESGALEGTTRGFIIKNFKVEIGPIKTLADCDGAFLTSAGHLATPIVEMDGNPLPIHPLVAQIRRACAQSS